MCVCVCVCVQSCLTLWDPMACSSPVPSVHGISQARKLEWVAISFSRGSSQPRDQTSVSYISRTGRRILYQLCHLGSPLHSYQQNLKLHSVILPRRFCELFPFPWSCYFRMFTEIGLRMENMGASSFISLSTQLLQQQTLSHIYQVYIICHSPW